MRAFDFVTWVEYNNWANKRLLAAAKNLSHDQLNVLMPLSHESAFEMLGHMLEFEWSWRMACEGYDTWILYGEMSQIENLRDLQIAWEMEGQRMLAYVQTLPPEGLEWTVTSSWIDKPFKIGQILMNMVNHVASHRRTVSWYLAECGYPPGDLDLLDFISLPTKQDFS